MAGDFRDQKAYDRGWELMHASSFHRDLLKNYYAIENDLGRQAGEVKGVVDVLGKNGRSYQARVKKAREYLSELEKSRTRLDYKQKLIVADLVEKVGTYVFENKRIKNKENVLSEIKSLRKYLGAYETSDIPDYPAQVESGVEKKVGGYKFNGARIEGKGEERNHAAQARIDENVGLTDGIFIPPKSPPKKSRNRAAITLGKYIMISALAAGSFIGGYKLKGKNLASELVRLSPAVKQSYEAQNPETKSIVRAVYQTLEEKAKENSRLRGNLEEVVGADKSITSAYEMQDPNSKSVSKAVSSALGDFQKIGQGLSEELSLSKGSEAMLKAQNDSASKMLNTAQSEVNELKEELTERDATLKEAKEDLAELRDDYEILQEECDQDEKSGKILDEDIEIIDVEDSNSMRELGVSEPNELSEPRRYDAGVHEISEPSGKDVEKIDTEKPWAYGNYLRKKADEQWENRNHVGATLTRLGEVGSWITGGAKYVYKPVAGFLGGLSRTITSNAWCLLTKGRCAIEDTWRVGESDGLGAAGFAYRNAFGPNHNKEAAETLEAISLGGIEFDTENDPFVEDDGAAGFAMRRAAEVGAGVLIYNIAGGGSSGNSGNGICGGTIHEGPGGGVK